MLMRVYHLHRLETVDDTPGGSPSFACSSQQPANVEDNEMMKRPGEHNDKGKYNHAIMGNNQTNAR
jgi:hypothetical protein